MIQIALLLAAAVAATSPATGSATTVTQATTDTAQATKIRPSSKSVPEFGVPGVVPVEQLWADFYARSDEDQALAAIGIAEGLFPKRNDPDGAACKASYDKLQQAARQVPISLEVWYVLHACAVVLHDDAREQQSEQALAALTRYAFARLPPDRGVSAIDVIQMTDAYVLALASGEIVMQDYFDIQDRVNSYPLVLVLRDPQTNRQRDLRFNWIGPVIGMRRPSTDALYPSMGVNIAEKTLISMAKFDDTAAQAKLVLDAAAHDEETEIKMAARIVGVAGDDNYGALRLAASDCLRKKDFGCAQSAVDALLPFAEKGDGKSLLYLARAHALGRGVKADSDAAKTLLHGAEKQLGAAGAYGLYLHMGWVGSDTTPIDDWVFDQLTPLADAGDPYAAMVAALSTYYKRGDFKAPFGERDRAWLVVAERAGLPEAGRLLATDAINRKDWPSAARYLRKWAAIDGPTAERLADAYDSGDIGSIPRDAALSLDWRRHAGMLGDSDAMRAIAVHYAYLGTEDGKLWAMKWIASAMFEGSVDAVLDAGDILLTGPMPGMDDAERMKKAAEMYSLVRANKDSPRARRSMAALLIDGRGVPKDTVQARKLLQGDADAGNAYAQYVLGRDLIFKKLDTTDPAEGWEWIRKAESNGSASATGLIATAMLSGDKGLPLDQRGGIDKLTRLVDTGNFGAANELAWFLCTSPDAAWRDPAKGLAASTPMALGSTYAPHLDTHAACLAANADFAQAVTVEQKAIANLPADATEDHTRMQQRVELYRQHKPYIQSASAVVTKPTTDATKVH